MIKSFKVSNNAYIKTGLVEAQVSTTNAVNVNKMNVDRAILPAYQAPLSNVSAIKLQKSNLHEITSPSISLLVTHLATTHDVVLSSLRSDDNNHIVQNTHLGDMYGVSNTMPYDNLAISTRKFSAYEQFTGISQDRPELIMMTNFQPLYDTSTKLSNNNSINSSLMNADLLTSSGEFFDYQTYIRSLRQNNVKQLITPLKLDSSTLQSTCTDRVATFNDSLVQLQQSVSFLLNLMGMLDDLKYRLDLHNEVYNFYPRDVLNSILQKFSGGMIAQQQYSTSAIYSNTHLQYTIADVLSKFKYTQDNVNNVYTSSKLYIQLMLELKEVLRTHSLDLFDIDAVQQKSDTSPVGITKTSTIKRFDYIAQTALLKLDQLVVQPIDAINSNVVMIVNAFNSLYENVHFKSDEIRIAALINLISREFRYSKNLSKQDVRLALANYYGYQVKTTGDNVQFLDYVVE